MDGAEDWMAPAAEEICNAEVVIAAAQNPSLDQNAL
jgi:hypothetical protein